MLTVWIGERLTIEKIKEMKSEGSVSGKRSVLLSHPFNEECWRAKYAMKKRTSSASTKRQIACVLQKKIQDLFRIWRSRFRSIPLALTHSHNSYSFSYNHLNYHSISSFLLTAKLRFGTLDFLRHPHVSCNQRCLHDISGIPWRKDDLLSRDSYRILRFYSTIQKYCTQTSQVFQNLWGFTGSTELNNAVGAGWAQCAYPTS